MIDHDNYLPDTVASHRIDDWREADVLVVTRGFEVQWGGAEASLLGVLQAVIGMAPATTWSVPEPELQIDRSLAPGPFQFARLAAQRAVIRDALKTFRGRTVLCQSLLAAEAVLACPRDTTVFYFLRDQFSWNEWANCETGVRRILKSAHKLALTPFWLRYKAANLRALRSADVAVANSRFTMDQARRLVSRDYELLFPPVPPAGSPAPAGEDVAMVGANADKGIAVLARLAAAFPAIRFRLYFRGPAPAGLPPNVTCVGWEPDRRAIYTGLRLFLVPSQWPEAYNRSAIEAQAFGVPVLASAVGGLAANVPATALVHDYHSPNAWIQAFGEVWPQATKLRPDARSFAQTRAAAALEQKSKLVDRILRTL